MRGLIAFTGLLLVVTFVENISGALITVSVGRNARLRGSDHDEHLLQCAIEHNGVNYNIYPDSNATFIQYYGGGRLCTFDIKKVNFSHSGEWKINTIVKSIDDSNESTKNDKVSSEQISHFLNVKESKRIYPTSKFEGEDGNYATLYFKSGFDNITKFYIVRNDYGNDTNYVLSGDGNGTSAGLELFGRHGVRIPTNKKWSGNWKLVQESGEYRTISGDFVILAGSRITKPEQEHEQWTLGSERMRISSSPYNQKYLEVQRPDGEVVSVRESGGVYKVGKVSYKHAGIWKARYLSEGSTNVLEKEIHVTVVDPRAINVTVTRTEDNMIHMLCKTYVYNIKYCIFKSPNGTIFNALSGIGNDKYEYFGTGYNEDSDTDTDECGLTIRQPSIEDYGLWKCILATKYYSGEILSAFVSTDNLTGKTTQRPHVTTKNVYVKRGDKFSIQCNTSESLDYCWFRSPNGTNFSVTKNYDHLPNTLPYFSEGLSLGVCGATIENANDTDAGNWSCRLGVTGGVEIESTVAVTVADSLLIPVRKTLNLAYDVPKLVMQLLPSADVTIKYCRWIRPNGHGFSEDSAAQYSRSQNDNTCAVFLNDWSSEDVGTWSCYASLNIDSDEEIHATMELAYKTETMVSNTLFNIVSICVVGITIFAGCILGYIFYKKRMSRPIDPPSYYNEFDTSKHFPIPVTEKSTC